MRSIFGGSRVAIALSALALVFAMGGTAFAAATVTSASIVNNTIQGIDILDGTVTKADIRDGTITGADIKAGTIQATDIGDGQVDGLNILDGTIATNDFINGAVAPRLFAVVAADGTLDANAGVSQTFFNGEGNYGVQFGGQTLAACALVVTPFNTGVGAVRFATANASGDTVTVHIKDATTAPVSHAFNLAVIC